MATPKKKLKCPCGRTFKHHLHLGRHAKSCALNPKYNKGFVDGREVHPHLYNDPAGFTATDETINNIPFNVVYHPKQTLSFEQGAIISQNLPRIEKLEKQVADLIAILAKVVK